MLRSSVVLACCFCCLAIISATGCSQQTDGAGQAKMVQIGTTKADLFGLPAEYRALHVRLEKCFGQPVSFSPQPDGPALAKQFELGNLSYAILSPTEYAQIEDASKLTPLAAGVNKLGKTSRKAFIVSRAGTGAKTILECKGKRFALPHAKMMIHQPYGQVGGQVSDIEIQAQEILKTRDVLNEILAQHTAQPIDRIAKDTDRDFYMTAEEAKAYGIVDDILSKQKVEVDEDAK